MICACDRVYVTTCRRVACPPRPPVPVAHLHRVDVNPQMLPEKDAESPSSRAPPPAFISDFPPPPPPPPLALQSSHSSSSGSSSQSPALLGALPAPAFALASPPVVAAMSLPTPVSAVESTSSTLVGSVSDLRFSPLSAAPPSSGQESGFVFPPPDVVAPRLERRDSSPDDPHLMVVGDMLKKYVPNPHRW